jgi:hypothetical protein
MNNESKTKCENVGVKKASPRWRGEFKTIQKETTGVGFDNEK